jgi:hypothetical protein
MGMSCGFGPARDKREMVSMLRTAVERGITSGPLVDLTADDLREIDNATSKITVQGLDVPDTCSA